MPSISYVVARSRPDYVIGCDNELPWHLRTDLKRFKAITLNHVIVMGRKTYLSIGKPLPGRINIVLSRRPDVDPRNTLWNPQDTMLLWAQSRESALFLADVISMRKEDTEFFVIGGADIFDMFQDLFNKVHITEVLDERKYDQGRSAYFSYKFDRRKWQLITDENIPAGPHDEFPSRFRVFERRHKTVRYVELDSFYTEADKKRQWITQKSKLIDATPPVIEKAVRDRQQYKMFVEHEKA